MYRTPWFQRLYQSSKMWLKIVGRHSFAILENPLSIEYMTLAETIASDTDHHGLRKSKQISQPTWVKWYGHGWIWPESLSGTCSTGLSPQSKHCRPSSRTVSWSRVKQMAVQYRLPIRLPTPSSKPPSHSPSTLFVSLRHGSSPATGPSSSTQAVPVANLALPLCPLGWAIASQAQRRPATTAPSTIWCIRQALRRSATLHLNAALAVPPQLVESIDFRNRLVWTRWMGVITAALHYRH